MRFPLSVLCATAFLLLAQPNPAQTAPAARVMGRVDDANRIVLKGNTPSLPSEHADLGQVSPDLRMTDLVLVLSRSAQVQAAFDGFVESQYDVSSPNFHRWLSPADVGERFGTAPADIAAVSEWLTQHGLTVTGVAKDRMSIRFSGTAAQVQSTFHTEIHTVSANGEQHLANLQDPQIPAALAPVVTGIKALHNFFPRPQHVLGSKVSFDPESGAWRKATDNESARADMLHANPQFGITIGTGTSSYQIEDVAPYDFATIYNVLPAWNQKIDGSGQTIAIAGTSDINTADVASFRSVFGLPAGTTPKTIVANGVDPGLCTGNNPYVGCTIDDLIENTLDVEWSGAVAKGANIVLVVSGQTSPTTDTIYSSADYVVENETANILNVSYGECELGLGVAGNAAYNNLWESAATEGISVFVAAGDAGSATCDQGNAPPHLAQYGTSVSGLASSPYDTAVGGTDLNWGTKAAPYWSTTNNSSNGSSALNYVPEVPWNDSCTNPLALHYLQEWAAALQKAGYSALSPTDAESACNFVLQWYITIYDNTSPQVDLSGFVNTWGGGGGISSCTTGDGQDVSSCTGGYPEPSWQTGVTGLPVGGGRHLPDVSFMAGNGFLGSAYLICVSELGSCVNSTSLTSEPYAQEVGGTSVGSPAMAGVMALINQKAGTPQGSPNAALYALAGKQNYANCKSETAKVSDGCDFNDIDSGNNAMACQNGSPDCNVAKAVDTAGILAGYFGKTGFDGATGLGSPNVSNVVSDWTSTVGTATATLTITPSLTNLPVDQALTIAVALSGSSGTPTGTVSLKGGGVSPLATDVIAGKAALKIPANVLTAGNDTLTVTYSGDANYARATGTTQITVTKLTPTVTVTATPTNVGAQTYAVSVTMTVSGGGLTPTGTITGSIAGTSISTGNCPLSQGTCTLDFLASQLPNGTFTIDANYSGDASYAAGSGSTTVQVLILTPTVVATPSKTNISTVDTITVKGVVSGSGVTPTGQVELDGPEGVIGYGTLDSSGTYTFTAVPGSFQGGVNNLTMRYWGDSIYLTANASLVVNATRVASTMAVTPSSTDILSNQPLTLTGTVTGTSGAPAPWGRVEITVGGTTYADYAGPGYSIAIPANGLPAGADVLTVKYDGNFMYNASTASTLVTVQQFTLATPTLTVTPSAQAIGTGAALQVAVGVTGAGAMPTGSVTLNGGGYASSSTPLAGDGTATFSIPSNTLSVGSDVMTVTYSGDAVYAPSAATTTITVTQSDFALKATSPTAVTPGQSSNSTLTVSTSDNYSGTVTITCSLTQSPAGAVSTPTCALLNPAATLGGGTTSANVNVTISTTAPTTSMNRPRSGMWETTGGVFFALLVMFGVPKRRRAFRSVLGIFAIALVLSGISACGGSGGSGGGGGGGTPGTTAGNYTFTLTGTGNPTVTPVPTTTFTVKVN